MANEEFSGLTAQELILKREEVEAELRDHFSVLEENDDVGLDGHLVDQEGYPRNDIDVYAVRKARNRIICLRNDHKLLMKLIEEQLHQIHAEARREGTVTQGSEKCSDKKRPSVFARVNHVARGSPASDAGLCESDELVTFGSVSADNFSHLNDIASVVQHSVGRPVRVVVLREGHTVSLSLIPHQWSGQGLLGCHFVLCQR